MFSAIGLADCIRVEVGDFFKIADSRLEGQTFDAMFKDGAHTRKATEEFFHHWAPRCQPGAMIIFDDLNHVRASRENHGNGMDQAWTAIAASPRVAYAAKLHRPGVIALR